MTYIVPEEMFEISYKQIVDGVNKLTLNSTNDSIHQIKDMLFHENEYDVIVPLALKVIFKELEIGERI